MKVVFFVLLLIFTTLLLVLWGIKFKVMVLLHAKNRSAYYALNNRFFSLMQGKVILLENGKVSVIVNSNKIFLRNSKEGLGSILGVEIMKKISVKSLDVYVDTTKVGDAMTTALFAGGVNGLSGIVSAILKNKKIETRFHVSHSKEDEDLTVGVDLNVRMSLMSFFIALIKAKKKYNTNYKKEKKYA